MNANTVFSMFLLFVKVQDANPVPGMQISPSEGVIPVGGIVDLKISFTPTTYMNIDKRVEVFQNWKNFVF